MDEISLDGKECEENEWGWVDYYECDSHFYAYELEDATNGAAPNAIIAAWILLPSLPIYSVGSMWRNQGVIKDDADVFGTYSKWASLFGLNFFLAFWAELRFWQMANRLRAPGEDYFPDLTFFKMMGLFYQ